MKMAKASPEETRKLFKWLQAQEEKGVNVPPWERTVFGYTVLVENCCDENAHTLERKPEYANLENDNRKLQKRIDALEKVLEEIRDNINPLSGSESMHMNYLELADIAKNALDQLKSDL